MKKLDLKIFVEEYTWDELPEMDKNLFIQAQQASKNAYAPYSQFLVGAALLLEDGKVLLGNNQENAAYPSGLCAERTAIFAAGANYPTVRITAIAIAACKATDQVFLPVTPCGACRQAILEYETRQDQSIRLIMPGSNNTIYVAPSIRTLLPLQFSRNNLLQLNN